MLLVKVFLAAGLAALLSGRILTPAGRPAAIFRSRETGPVQVIEISGNSNLPFSDPPTRLTITLADRSKAAIFRRLVRTRAFIASATIDDSGDGEQYALQGLTMVGYFAANHGVTNPDVTFDVRVLHVTCGPPTCLTPRKD